MPIAITTDHQVVAEEMSPSFHKETLGCRINNDYEPEALIPCTKVSATQDEQ